eukprot:2965199-Amphidinium_carterae.1
MSGGCKSRLLHSKAALVASPPTCIMETKMVRSLSAGTHDNQLEQRQGDANSFRVTAFAFAQLIRFCTGA